MKTIHKGLLLFLMITLWACSKENNPEDNTPIGRTIEVTDDITKNTTWLTGYTYILVKNIDVTNGAILTIEPGVTIRFNSKKYLRVGYGSGGFGTILAEGTELKPILFTSSSAIKNAGDWDGIWLYESSAGTVFKHCKFEYSGGYSANRGTIISKSTFSFDNSTIENSENNGIVFTSNDAGFESFSNNNFRTIESNPIVISAQNAHTIGTNNLFDNTNNISLLAGQIKETGTVKWLKQNVAYQVDGNVKIGSANGTTLEITPGTTVMFGSGKEMLVAYSSSDYGGLKMEGTSGEPVTITSASPFPAKGDWSGIWFYDGTTNSSFKNTTISYGGGYSNNSGNLNFRGSAGLNVTIEKSNITDSQNWGIYKHTSAEEPTLIDVDFSNNTSGDKNY